MTSKKEKIQLFMDGAMIFMPLLVVGIAALSALGSTLVVLGFVGVAAALFKLYKIKQATPQAVPVNLFYANIAAGALSMVGALMLVSAKIWTINPDGAAAAFDGRMGSLASVAFIAVFTVLYWYNTCKLPASFNLVNSALDDLVNHLNDSKNYNSASECANDIIRIRSAIQEAEGEDNGEFLQLFHKKLLDSVDSRRRENNSLLNEAINTLTSDGKEHESVQDGAEDFVRFHDAIAEMGREDKEKRDMFLFFQKSMANSPRKRRHTIQMARDMGCSEEEVAKLAKELGIEVPPVSTMRELLMDEINELVKQKENGQGENNG